MADKKESKAKKGAFGRFLDDVKENIAEGTKVFQEESTEVLGKIKEKASDAYEAGAEVVESIGGKVQDFTEHQKLQQVLKKMEGQRIEKVREFGEEVIHEYLNTGSVHKRFLTTKKMNGLVEEIKSLDKNMADIKKQLS